MQLQKLLHTNPGLRLALSPILAVRQAVLRRLNQSGDDMLSRLAQSLRDDVVLSVAEFGGDFAMSPTSDLFARLATTGSYEPEIASLFRGYIDPGRDVIDIGANIGLFTVLAGTRLSTGRVLAVEPTSGAYGRLQRNIHLNNCAARVIACNVAVTETAGQVSLNAPVGREEYASMGTLTHPGALIGEVAVEVVEGVPLDVMVQRYGLSPCLIKIDVEGAEAQVLAGGRQTLIEHRPVIIAELVQEHLEQMGSSIEQVARYLTDLGYRVQDARYPASPLGTSYEVLATPT